MHRLGLDVILDFKPEPDVIMEPWEEVEYILHKTKGQNEAV